MYRGEPGRTYSLLAISRVPLSLSLCHCLLCLWFYVCMYAFVYPSCPPLSLMAISCVSVTVALSLLALPVVLRLRVCIWLYLMPAAVDLSVCVCFNVSSLSLSLPLFPSLYVFPCLSALPRYVSPSLQSINARPHHGPLIPQDTAVSVALTLSRSCLPEGGCRRQQALIHTRKLVHEMQRDHSR